MGKNTVSSGNSVFGQLISLLPKNKIGTLVNNHQADRYTKRFRTMDDHLLVMLFAALAGCSTLREIESGIAGFHTKLLHPGLKSFPKRSTLSDANSRRSAEVFEAVFNAVYTQLQPFLSDSCPKNQKWLQKLFLLDSTTITLFKEIMKACGRTPANGKRKGGIKIHVGMHLSENTPSVVRITSAATNDKNFLYRFKNIEQDTILVFDKAYVNYSLYNHLGQTGVTFVTRLHQRSVVNVVETLKTDPEQKEEGVLSEQIVELGHTGQKEKVKCRLIRFYDRKKDRILEFITNDMTMKASCIAEIYRQRWQIELLFKRLKQNLQLSNFLGDNENAVRIQIWCNLIADLLLMAVRRGVKTKKAYSNVAGLIRLHLMNYVLIKDLLNNPGDSSIFKEKVQTYYQGKLAFRSGP